jgi:hypothetical protein
MTIYTNALDDLFTSLIIPVFLCMLGVVFLGLLLIFRFEIGCFLDDYVLPACAYSQKAVSAWKNRHSRLVALLDKYVVGPFVIVSFGLSVMIHHWFWAFVWGIHTFWFRERLKKRRPGIPDDAELHQLLVEVESDIKARDR